MFIITKTPFNSCISHSYCMGVAAFKLHPLQWRHNEHDSVSNHHSHDCLLNRLFRRRSKTSKLRFTGLCVGNSPGTGEFPAQRASTAENVSISWRHHAIRKIQAVWYGNVESFHGLSLLTDKLVFSDFWDTLVRRGYCLHTLRRFGTHHSCLQFNNHTRMSFNLILTITTVRVVNAQVNGKLFLYWSWYYRPPWSAPSHYLNVVLLLIGPLGTNFSEMSIKSQDFWMKEMRLKMSSANCRPFKLGLIVFTYRRQGTHTEDSKLGLHSLRWWIVISRK